MLSAQFRPLGRTELARELRVELGQLQHTPRTTIGDDARSILNPLGVGPLGKLPLSNLQPRSAGTGRV